MRCASMRLEAIVLGTEVDFIETLKFVNSRRSISSTVSTAAVTSASTGLSNSSSRICLGSEPELTPTRSGGPRRGAASGGRAGGGAGVGARAPLRGPADVAGFRPPAVRARLDRLQRQGVVEVDVGDH